jgi:hypothetical protein
MDDFNERLNGAFVVVGAIDNLLKGKSLTDKSKLADLTDKSKAAISVKIPIEAGTRVRFLANLGSVLSYDHIPANETEGTVVKVKAAGSNLTSLDGRVFVQWDDGHFASIQSEHLGYAKLNKRMANNIIMHVASLGNLDGFMRLASGDELVHKATKDIWSFRKDSGGYVIERLFNTDGKPLKV